MNILGGPYSPNHTQELLILGHTGMVVIYQGPPPSLALNSIMIPLSIIPLWPPVSPYFSAMPSPLPWSVPVSLSLWV